MCDICEQVKAGNTKAPYEMIGARLVGTTEYDEPIFEDAEGNEWLARRHPIFEDTLFVPHK